jgi:hypothetical protein
MDFGALPPEVNSARMYAGAGSAPLLVAAAGWDGLAEDLYAAAAGYGSVVSGLTAVSWRGPASVSMAAAAASYVGWLNASAALAAQAGGIIPTMQDGNAVSQEYCLTPDLARPTLSRITVEKSRITGIKDAS